MRYMQVMRGAVVVLLRRDLEMPTAADESSVAQPRSVAGPASSCALPAFIFSQLQAAAEPFTATENNVAEDSRRTQCGCPAGPAGHYPTARTGMY